jgi:uncharacterized protein (TIGR03546 family)
MPIVPFTRFNNTIVMGAGVVSIILAPLIFIGAKILVSKYRILVVDRFKDTKLFKAWTKTALYQWYYKYDTFFASEG